MTEPRLPTSDEVLENLRRVESLVLHAHFNGKNGSMLRGAAKLLGLVQEDLLKMSEAGQGKQDCGNE